MKNKLSTHFKRSEFECGCECGFDTVDYQLIKVIEELRVYYKQPIRINSACRCLKHNTAIGSKPTSQHVKGKAADITVSGISPIVVYHRLDTLYPDKFGFGVYDNFNHIDVRSEKVRWDKRS